MLLTICRSLNLDLSAKIDNDALYDALRLVMKRNESQLNQALWELIQNRTALIQPEKITLLLEGITSCDEFNEVTWVLLHLIHNHRWSAPEPTPIDKDVASTAPFSPKAGAENQQDLFNQYIINKVTEWLTSSTMLESENTMQARLFLMSQQPLVVIENNIKHIIDPILSSQHSWAYLALLSYLPNAATALSAEQAQRLQANMPIILGDMPIETYIESSEEKQASTLLVFMKSSGITNAECVCLLDNIASLHNAYNFVMFPSELLIAIMKLSNRVNAFTEEVKGFLGRVGAIFASRKEWLLKDQQDKLKKLRSQQMAENDIAVKEQKYLGEQALELINQFLYIIQSNLLDDFLAFSDRDAIADNINKALGYSAANNPFCRNFCNALWDPTKQRQCRNDAIDWLIDLKIFKEFKFFLFKSQATTILQQVFDSRDEYAIQKFFAIERFSPEQLSVVIPNILQYLKKEGAHTEFKSLHQVQQILDLEYILIDAKSTKDLEGRENHKTLQHAEIFTRALQYHYQSALTRVLGVLENSKAKETERKLAYKRLKRTHGILETLTQDQKDQLRDDKMINLLALQYRLGRALNTIAKAQDVPWQVFVKKPEKIEFLRYLIEHYVEIAENKYPAGIMPASEAYRQIRHIGFSDYKEEDMEKWFRGTILYSAPYPIGHGSETAQTLMLLPDGILEAIFAGTSITVKDIWTCAYPHKPYPTDRNAQRDEALQRDSETTDTNSEDSQATGAHSRFSLWFGQGGNSAYASIRQNSK